MVNSLEDIRESYVDNPSGTRMFFLCLLFMWQLLESSDPTFDARVWNSDISMLEYSLNKKECCLLLCSLGTPGCLCCVLINVLCLLLGAMDE